MLRWLKCHLLRKHNLRYCGYGNHGLMQICKHCGKTKIITPSIPYKKDK